jgi:hypothetical protein
MDSTAVINYQTPPKPPEAPLYLRVMTIVCMVQFLPGLLAVLGGAFFGHGHRGLLQVLIAISGLNHLAGFCLGFVVTVMTPPPKDAVGLPLMIGHLLGFLLVPACMPA